MTIRDSGRLAEHDRLINIAGSQNLRISGLGARITSERGDYTSGEQRHCIYGAKRVVIEGLESSSHGGDGFYIGGDPSTPAEDVTLRGCRADNDRRQGLSITSARRVRVIDCEFVNTNGTAPEFGIDLEPDYPFEVLEDITFLRPQTQENRGGGILIALQNLDASSPPVNITIVDHTSVMESPPLDAQIPEEVNAVVRYNRASG